MTNEEAIKKLKEQQNEFNEHYIDYAGINEAYNMAIRSLEAWEKVKEEISEIYFSHNMSDKYGTVYGECLKSLYEIKNEALDIINKYLKEVSE